MSYHFNANYLRMTLSVVTILQMIILVTQPINRFADLTQPPPPTSEVSGLNPEPHTMWESWYLLTDVQAVYIAEPWPSGMYWFPLPFKLPVVI